MHVALVSTRPVPDQDVYAREQSAALSRLGHEITLFAPGSRHANGWSLHDEVAHVNVDPLEQPERSARTLRASNAQIVHAYEVRGISRLLRHLDVPAVVELRSVPLRPPVQRLLGLARMWFELRDVAYVGSPNPQLVARAPFVRFLAPAGWSTWADEVRRARDPVPGRVVYQGSPNRVRQLGGLVKAFARALERRPEAELVLLLRGVEGTPSWVRDLPAPVAGRVRVLGSPTREALVEQLRTAHVTVSWVPRSRGLDHQPPLKILDALAAEVPIVATDTSASCQLLSGGAGRIAPARPAAFARALLEALDRPPSSPPPPTNFRRDRSWHTIVRDIWLPRYHACLDQRAGEPVDRGP